ncbi:hypothetical protein EJ02DRAFT_421696 [Clathrospora elynae]|uniref:Uncharacterized protein n=1 Tax=Clathrospora elynae TaxID=706981 RepID=A0A6A5ST20_9PLEO|nr:hypothetical protein EJ02DRAFT_421696 [Clathrospora elynae]
MRERETKEGIGQEAQERLEREAPLNYNGETQSTPSTEDNKAQDAARENNKIQKMGLESHSEPIITQTCGIKRNLIASELTSESNTFFDSTTKKQKRKLASDSSPHHRLNPKLCTNAPPKFGEASFLAPLVSMVGAIVRKREGKVYVERTIES